MSIALIAWRTTPRRPMFRRRAVHRLPDVRRPRSGGRPTTSGSSWRRISTAAGLPKPAVPTPTTAVGVLELDDDEPRPGRWQAGRRRCRAASTKPSSEVSGVPTGRPSPFGAGSGRAGTVEIRTRATDALTRDGARRSMRRLAEPTATRSRPTSSVRHRGLVDPYEQSALIIRLIGLTSQPSGAGRFCQDLDADGTSLQGA